MNESLLAALLGSALLAALSWSACRAALRWPDLKLPLTLYIGAYGVTTAIGAAIIGLAGPEVLPAKWGMDLSYLHDLGATYWLLLFLPLIVPPVVAAELERRAGPSAATPPPALPPPPTDGYSPLAVFIPFVAISAACAYILTAGGYGSTLADMQSMSGDFQALMTLRFEMMASLGNAFFGLVYTTLPTLCHCALYLAATRRQPACWALFLIIFGTTAFFCLAVVQKTLILLLLIFTAIAAVELRLVSGRIFALAGAAGLAMLGALQFIFQGESWTLLDSLALIIFRMSSSFPYYVKLYPSVLPYGGVDLGLNIIGLGVGPRDPMDVFALSYPSVTIEGASPAAAHVRAYSQAGLPWSLATAIAIGVTLYIVARSRRRIAGPISFALHIQLLVLVYYLTQTSSTETITSSYGIMWALFGLAAVAATQALLTQRAPGPSSDRTPSRSNG